MIPLIIIVSLAAIWSLLFLALKLIELGEEYGREDMESEAVKAGHAEYYLDENSERKWRWK